MIQEESNLLMGSIFHSSKKYSRVEHHLAEQLIIITLYTQHPANLPMRKKVA
jgi:hypothetical protein